MLKLIESAEQLPYGPIMNIYESSNRMKGKQNFPQLSDAEQLLLAEQEFYGYLQDVLEKKLAILALWLAEGQAVAALRLEKYKDGLLLTGLETAPAERRRGYASSLICAAVNRFPNCKIYSHIFSGNHASATLHKKCGFQKIADVAELLDGSTTHEAATYLHG